MGETRKEMEVTQLQFAAEGSHRPSKALRLRRCGTSCAALAPPSLLLTLVHPKGGNGPRMDRMWPCGDEGPKEAEGTQGCSRIR